MKDEGYKYGMRPLRRRRGMSSAAAAELSERLQGAGGRVARLSSTGECLLGSSESIR